MGRINKVWKTLRADEHFFGLGDKTGPLDRRAQTFDDWNTDAFMFQERYANHILCHEDLRGILEAWDRAEKKIFHGGVVLYRIR